MKKPNYEDQQSKHPIPHAKGIAKDERGKPNQGKTDSNASKEEE